ncbi:hypothetical protein GIS00_14060 [Nakamurella sp. YIM 132087]|uniref:SnoaL-like domain-containing protein n=1 Tax=Nakamurella alba TaxID=2665158 RepID=A0A7K1FPB4_9ACTN|nr:nuclear transport factor 2 family protein [Nakamurella alba]MTD15063.1 hypothetical protein [Nakamurella alba]
MSDIALPKAVADFVAATNAHDTDGLLAVFADGAVVSDDGHTLTTATEIRSWIGSHLIDPQVVLSPTSYENNRLVASAVATSIAAPMNFAFDLAITGDLVTDLSIDLA